MSISWEDKYNARVAVEAAGLFLKESQLENSSSTQLRHVHNCLKELVKAVGLIAEGIEERPDPMEE